MRREILLSVTFLGCSLFLNAQNDSTIYLNKIEESKFYKLQSKGWVILDSGNGENQLANFSNKEYYLYFSLDCKTPSYLIEYNDNYRDGDFGGVDFASSREKNFQKTSFLIDGKDFKNPFDTDQKNSVADFKSALMKGKKLSIQFFNEEFNPEKGEDELKLNREISFILQNNDLLKTSVTCK